MYARLQMVRTLPPAFTMPEGTERFVQVLAGHPGFRGAHPMLQIGTRQGLMLTLWDSRQDADAAPARTHAALGPAPFALAHDEMYDVLAVADGPSPVDGARVGHVLWFDGPRSAAQNEAIRRAGEERIQPVVEGLDGFARTYVLCRPEDSAVVIVTLATSTEALERITEAIFATELLPGEDPALLGDPDRVEIYRVGEQSRTVVPVA